MIKKGLKSSYFQQIILLIAEHNNRMSILYQNKTVVNNYDRSFAQEGSQDKATVSFISKKQRFGNKIERSPGPGSYEQKSSNFKLNQYHIRKDSDSKAALSREHQWIFGSDRTSYIQNKNYVGPGSYNISDPQLAVYNGTKNTNWGKEDRFKYKSMKKSDPLIPGPGSYENKTHVQEMKNSLGSVFKSKSPKTYMDKLFSESSVQNLKQSIQIEMFDNPEVPKTEEKIQSKSPGKKKQNSSVFASKIPRISDSTANINQNVGPGSYDCTELGKQKSKDKLPKIVTVKSDDRNRKIVKKPDPAPPGPGDYEANLETIEKHLTKKGHYIPMGKQERFKQKVEVKPGPGHYMQNKYQFASQIERIRKPMIEKPSFNSSSQRSKPELQSMKNPFGSYNLEHFDMQYRLKKKQQHIDKLKIMEVSLPAFNTKSRK